MTTTLFPRHMRSGVFPISKRTTTMRAIDFRVQAFAHSLDPDHRADVARRARFYTLPWLRCADTPDDDMLP